MGVRYRKGGTTSRGIDCSAFTASVLYAYTGTNLPRTCREQYQQYPRVSQSEIEIGDLLFFRTRGRAVSHVGIYLGNNKFVHASSSNGVVVSSRNEPYFSTRFAGARRVSKSSQNGSAFK
ncbi:MAG: NlpC/P60 family protein [Bacteroidetes bacterium]|nr:NlpC/P60 family protein [Bacteroidota bacterium]